MKKLMAFVLVCCLILGVMGTTLAEEPAAATLLERVLLVAADGADLIQMTADDLYDLIGIAPEEYTDFAYLADYNSLSGRELIVLYAVDEDAAVRIEELLQAYLEIRKDETRNYLPEAYDVLCEAEVARNELTVVLSIAAPTEDEQQLLLTGE